MFRKILAFSGIAILSFCLATIARSADTVVIVMDDSGSMADRMKASPVRITRIEAAKKALSQVIDSLPDGTQLGILLLNGQKQNNHWLVPPGPLNRPTAKTQVMGLVANGGTPLGERIQQAMNELLQIRAKQIYGSYRLIVVTDGEATDAQRLQRVLPGILARGIPVDVIGVDMAQNHSLATQVRSYRRADDEAQFSQAMTEVLAESQGSGDGAESDFEWIAPLSDEMATAVLAALAKPLNAPVQLDENPLGAAAPAVQSAPDQDSYPASGSANFAQPNTGSSSWTDFLGGACCIAFIAIMILAAVIIKSSNRKR